MSPNPCGYDFVNLMIMLYSFFAIILFTMTDNIFVNHSISFSHRSQLSLGDLFTFGHFVGLIYVSSDFQFYSFFTHYHRSVTYRDFFAHAIFFAIIIVSLLHLFDLSDLLSYVFSQETFNTLLHLDRLSSSTFNFPSRPLSDLLGPILHSSPSLFSSSFSLFSTYLSSNGNHHIFSILRIFSQALLNDSLSFLPSTYLSVPISSKLFYILLHSSTFFCLNFIFIMPTVNGTNFDLTVVANTLTGGY